MKLTIAILACLAIAGVSAVSVHKVSEKNIPVEHDKTFLEKQKFLYEIVYRIEDPLMFEEYIKMGDKIIFDETKYYKFEKDMVQFYDTYKVGGLLPKGEFFSIGHKYHFLSGQALYKFFLYAKDWETFVYNVCWARMNVNEGMFVYALTLAVTHRVDMKGLILPPIYEIFPQMFFNSQFIYHAEKFDFDTFNRQIMLEKELKTIYDKEFDFSGDRFYLKDWKMWQWWKLMGIDEDWHFEEKTIFRNNIDILKHDPKYKAVWEEVKAVWYPVDYTRDVEFFNKESVLSYFTEDVGLNAYWYYFNMDMVKSYGKEFDMYKDRRGEWFIFNMQQLVSRYYMEHLSHGFGEIDDLSLYETVKYGYDPQLVTYSGQGFTYRKNYYEFETYHNFELLDRIMNVESRIFDIIDSGKYVTKDGVKIDFTKPESVEYIGSILHGNMNTLDRKFLGYWYIMCSAYMSGQDINAFIAKPNVLLNFETVLRDPISFQVFKKLLYVFYQFISKFPAYSHEELMLDGVKIEKAEVSKMTTFFDLYDTDVTNLLNDKMVFHDGKFVWDKTLLARQMRLNHKPFTFKLNVKSDKTEKVIVKTFLAPDFNEFGEKIDIFKYRENFMLLDEFVYDLLAGETVIERSSTNFDYTIKDFTTYTELYKYVMLAYEGKYEYPEHVIQPHCGFPDRLIFPRGWVGGMRMKMFFMIVPYTATEKQVETYGHSYTCGFGTGLRHIDNLPFSYPFDRKIENVYQFFVPNMYLADVKIYHEEKYDKYFPMKYEHFGTFDYSF